MKAIVEINDKTLNLVSSVLMNRTDSEYVEKKIEEVVEKLKHSEEPYFVEIEKIDYDGPKKLLPLAIAMFVVGLELGKIDQENKLKEKEGL